MNSAAINYYSGSYDYDGGGNIYVHLHAKNIGKAMNGSSVSPSEVAQIFTERKQQAYQASKTQFTQLFKNSLNQKSQQLLNEVMDDEDLMTELQNEMGKKFQQALEVDKMQKLMELQRSGIATDNFAKIIINNSKDSVKNFNKLLDTMAAAAKMLNSEQGDKLAVALSVGARATGSMSMSQMGAGLRRALNDFEKSNNKKLMTKLEIQQIDSIVQSINSLASMLETGKLANKKDKVSASAIRRMTESIFNTAFAESISAILKETAYIAIDKEFKSALTGATQVAIQYSNEFGQAIKEKGIKAYGKADASFSNVKMKIDSVNDEINIDIGISDKFYKTNYFPNLPGHDSNQSYSSGSGGTLTEALWSTFGSNLRYLYFAYNSLGHGNRSGWDIAQNALNDVILTRQITRLFAARGGNQDFAQFMFVNGQIIPIWDIIMSTKQSVGLSQSQGGNDQQAVSISIPDRGEIQKVAQNYRRTTQERIYAVNKTVNKAKILAHVNLNNLTI